jgi:hypothetical protein
LLFLKDTVNVMTNIVFVTRHPCTVWRPFKHVSDEMLGAGMEPMLLEEVVGDAGGAVCQFASGAENDAAPAEGAGEAGGRLKFTSGILAELDLRNKISAIWKF